jgi:hypothetical protein
VEIIIPPRRWVDYQQKRERRREVYLSANPRQDMHAMNPGSGRVVVYEVRKREVVGQLDLERDIQRVQSGQVNLLALRMGETTMLLLEQRVEGAHLRLRVTWNVRKDFFMQVAEQDVLILV